MPATTSRMTLSEPSDRYLVARLLGAGSADLDPATLTRVINRARSELAGSPPEAMPELLERLVRERLNRIRADRGPAIARD